MLKTSRHIVEATKVGLERMTAYVKSSPERKQIGDFIFPDEKVPEHVKKQESYKNVRSLFDELSEAIKEALSQKKEVVKQGKLEAKAKEDLQVEAANRESRKNQLQLQPEINHTNEPNLRKEDTKKYEDLLKEKPKVIQEPRDETAAKESVIIKSDKVEGLRKIIVKEKLESPEIIKERGNETVEDSVITQVEELPEVAILKDGLENQEIIKGSGNKSVITHAAELPEVTVQEELEEETQRRTERLNQELQRELEETKRLLQERTEELHNVKERAEKMEVKQTLENGIPDDQEGKTRTRSLENSRSLQTKTWIVEPTLNEDQSHILRERMTQLYDATCKDLESDIFKLLDTLQFKEIKKHDVFRGNVLSKMKIINQLLSEGDEAVDAEYKSLISLLEEERARLQTILNIVWQEGHYVQSTLKKIEDIVENTKELESEVDKFQGNSKNDKKFLDLEHKLLNNVMKLDVMQAKGHDEIRKKRAEADKYASSCLEKLDANIKEIA